MAQISCPSMPKVPPLRSGALVLFFLEEVERSQEYLLVLENLPGFFVDAI